MPFLVIRSVFILWIVLSTCVASFAVAEDYYQQAHNHYRNADTRSAIIQLKNLLQQDPKHREGRLLLGKIYLENRQFPAAEKELRRAFELDIAIVKVTPSMVAALIGLQRYQDALDFLEKHWGTDLGDPARRWMLMGNAYLGMQALEQAEQAYHRSIAIDASPEASLGLAQATWARGNPQAALSQLASIETNDAVGLQALLLRGQILLSLREGNKALHLFSQVLEREPEHLKAHLMHAQAAMMIGKADLAVDDIPLLLAKAPQQPEVMLLAAHAALMKQDYQNAKAHAERLLLQAPNDLQGVLVAGIANHHLGQFEKAASQLQSVLSQAPGQPVATRFMAATLLKQNKAKQAIELLEPFLSSGIADVSLKALAGNAHLRLGNWETAENLLSESMEAIPDNDHLANQIALSRLLRGRTEDAIQLLNQQTEASNLHSDIIRLTAFVADGETVKARILLQTLIAANPDKIELHLLFANFELRQGNTASALSILQTAEKITPEHPGLQIELARLDLLNNAPEKAKQRYRKIIKTQPDHLQALLGLSQTSQAMGDTKEFIYWLQQARQKQPDAIHPARLLVRYYMTAQQTEKALYEAQVFYSGRERRKDATLFYADTLRMSGDPERAEHTLQKLLLDHPDYPQALAGMAEVLRDQGRAEEGLKYTTGLYESMPAALPVVLLHADLLIRTNDDGKAREVLNTSWEQQPSIQVARQLGMLEARQGDWPLAKQYLEQAHQGIIDPQLLQMMLEVELQLTGPAGRRALLEQYLSDVPTDAFAHLQLATIYQQKGENEKAIKQYEEIKRLQPGYPVAWNNLAWLYFNTGNPHSLAHALEAHRLAPNSPNIQDTLGWILLNTGDKKKGLEMLSRALKGLPNNVEIRYHRAAALAANQRNDEARFALLRLSKEATPFQQEIETLLQKLN